MLFRGFTRRHTPSFDPTATRINADPSRAARHELSPSATPHALAPHPCIVPHPMPRHLVAPIHERTPIPALLAPLQEAHGFLVEQARQTVPKLAALPPERWGIAAKRVYVELPSEGRPSLVSDAAARHSFARW